MRTLCLCAPILAACAADWQVDQPSRWWDPQTSHHGKHAVAGIACGALTFEAASLVTDDRLPRYTAAIAVGAVVGFGYEDYHGGNGTYKDPIDGLWVTAGAAIGAVLADATNSVVSIALHHDSAAVAFAFDW